MTGTANVFLTPAEFAFIEAAVDRLIPADALGPGAKEARVAVFIDRQLASAWGTHGRQYRGGPWAEGTPQQGYQSPLTPQALYRAAVRETDAWCKATRGKAFAFLAPDDQDDVLRLLEAGTVPLPSVDATVFFALLWRNTQEGFFADPIHGGNHDKIGWRLIGFPGVGSSQHSALMTPTAAAYRVEPVSILDIVEGRATVDASGLVVHEPSRTAR